MFKHFRQYLSTTSIQPDAGRKQVSSRVPAAAINPITLAIVVAFSAIALPQTVLAACTSAGVGTYLCEGENTAGIVLNGADIAVETQPGFSITEPGTDPALSLIGSGAISYLDTHSSVLDSASAYSLYIENDTYATGQSTSINVQTNGSMSNGINIYNQSAADSTIQVDASGMLSGDLNGTTALYISSFAEGDSTVSVNTQAISGLVGIESQNYSNSGTTITNIDIAGDINVNNSAAVIYNSGVDGIGVINFNSKNINAEFEALHLYNSNDSVITNVNIDGDISTTSATAGSNFSNWANNGSSSFTLRANNVTNTLNVNNTSDNGATITDIMLTGMLRGDLYIANRADEGDVKTSIKLNDVYSEGSGVNVNAQTQSGDLLLNLDVPGNILSTIRDAINTQHYTNDGNSAMFINVNNIISSTGSIVTDNWSQLGSVYSAITASGYLTNEGNQGRSTVEARTNSAQGDATAVINLKDITARASGGVDIRTSASEGISATYLTVTGQITAIGNNDAFGNGGYGGNGITVDSQAHNGTALAHIDVNNITSEFDAIYLTNTITGVDNGESTIDVTTRGALVSQQGYGINIETNAAESHVTVGGLVHGGNGTAIGIHRLDNIDKSATLELQSGYALEGVTRALVFNGSNANDLNDASLSLANSHLVLGGAGDATFDLSRIDNREEAILDGDPNRITGFGTLAKTGESLWILTGSNTTNGAVNLFSSASVEAGVLALDNTTLGVATGTALTVANGGALSSIGTSTLSGNMINAGEVLLSNQYTGGNGRFTGDELTITGNYAGNNGASLVIDTVLGDDNAATDRLVIKGDVSGTSSVKVNNVGGNGAETLKGINIIGVGGLSSDSSFLLDGDYVTKDGRQAVIGGAYAYTLYADGDALAPGRDWYLSSEMLPEEPGIEIEGPRYQPGVPLYEQYPQVLAALNTLPTLQQRVGNRYWSVNALADSIDNNDPWAWGRIEGSRQSSDPARSTSRAQRDIDVWKLQTGVDIPLHQYSDGSLLAGGVNFSYGKASADISSYYGDGSIDTSGYGVGTSLTWYGTDGIYIDGQLQTMWFDSDLQSDTLGRSMTSGNKGRGYASSVEVGKRYMLNDEGLSLTPQIQLTYSRVDFDTFRDPYGSEVSLQEGDNVRGRVGTSLDKETVWVVENGTTSRAHVYGNVDLYNEFTNGTKIKDSGVEFSTRDERQSVGVGAGGTYEWQNGRYAVYGNVNLLSASRNVGDNHTIGGTIGARVSW